MTRKEHLEWVKQRALAYLDNNDITGAWASLSSDMLKHEETAFHIGLTLGNMQILQGELNTKEQMKNFIEGFN
jgi:hypothetical protein